MDTREVIIAINEMVFLLWLTAVKCKRKAENKRGRISERMKGDRRDLGKCTKGGIFL